LTGEKIAVTLEKQIFGLAVFIGAITFFVTSAAQNVPSLSDEVSTGEEFEKPNVNIQVNLSDYKAVDSMNLTIGGADTLSGNKVEWNGSTNSRGEQYGWISYDVSNQDEVAVRTPESGGIISGFIGTLIQAYDGNGNKLSDLTGTPGSNTIDVSGVSTLELRDYSSDQAYIERIILEPEAEKLFSGVSNMLDISFENRLLQLVVGIPIGIFLAMVALEISPLLS